MLCIAQRYRFVELLVPDFDKLLKVVFRDGHPDHDIGSVQ
jgi:hypothetical protein